jgi:glycosyltransferase involved in cell wall biosynthesis
MIHGTLSLVLPAHNEEENIHHVVAQALRTLPRFADDFEIIVVDDGSTDSTGSVVRAIADDEPRVRLVEHPMNRGYGAALRSGFSASTGEWVMIMDSDRQFDIGDLVYLAPHTSQHELIAGYRIQRNDPFHRTLFGKTFRLAMRVLFGIQLRDIDCAFKLIRGDMLRSLALESDGAMISTELMARWARIGGTWTQVGVHHYPRTAGEQSGGSVRVILRAVRDVPVLWYRLQREPTEIVAGRFVENQAIGLSPAAAFSLLAVILGILTFIAARILRQH